MALGLIDHSPVSVTPPSYAFAVTRDWEATLRFWVKPPSDNEDEKRNKTEDEIRAVLRASSRLKPISYKVYAKGSYANNTNVRLDYDVDIAVECTEFFYHDQTGAAADVKKAAVEKKMSAYTGGYTRSQFKDDVEQALVDYYGSSAVKRGNMAIRVRQKKTTLPADVVPCFEYHYVYDIDFWGNLKYHQGTRIYPDKGNHIHNWPKQQYMNGVAKNDATGRRFKRIVRALKRLENELCKAGLLEAELPSFLMECLVYNVPNDHFNNKKYMTDMQAVLASIFNQTRKKADCSDWLEVNERKYLFHTSQPWTYQQAHSLVGQAWDYMGFE
jgi:hypothetical protein